MAIKIRRGLDADRLPVVFDQGEIVYTTDTKLVFIGDGVTPGGNPVSSVTYASIVAALGYVPADDAVTVKTTGLYANPSWLTSLAWGKITGTPTTLSGYGITDAVLSSTTLTINGVSYDLTANRSWSVGTYSLPGGGTTADYIDGTGALQVFPTLTSADKMITVGRNATGSTLYKGTVVYISGSTGNKPNFVKAQANAEATSAGTFGVIYADIANNADGQVVTIGTVDNLDTRSTATHPFTDVTLADGDTVYLHPTIAGYITNVKPYAPYHLVYVGKVTRTSPTNGTIVYRIQNGYELDELHDVAAQTPSDNDGLFYETSTSLWKNKSIATVLGYTPQPLAANLTSISALTFASTSFVKMTAAGTFALDTNTYLTAETDTLASVTGRGNTTTNAITVGGLTANQSVTASGAIARGVYFNNTLIASANNDVLVGLDIAPTFTNGAFTGVTSAALRVAGNILPSTTNSYSLGSGTLGFKDIFAVGNVVGNKIFGSIFAFNSTDINFRNVSDVNIARWFSTGNLTIQNGGTFTDAGFRLDVNGTARIQGTTTITPTAVTGALTTSSLDIAQTWNTTGTPIAIKLNVTDTASGNLSDLLQLQVGGSPRFRILKSGFFTHSSGGEISGGVVIGGATINTSSILEARSLTQGFLPPRMTTTQKNAIATPPSGLIVYDNTLGKLCVRGASTWETITSI